MEDKTLTIICLSISTLGILGIILTTNLTEPKTSEITKENLNKIISIEGKIESLRETPATYKITINNNLITVFKTKKLGLKKGDFIRVSGKVQEYNGRLELIASRIIT